MTVTTKSALVPPFGDRPSRQPATDQWFRLFYEQAPVAYQSLDAEARILDVNPAWLELLGLGPGDKDGVIGRPIADFLAPGQLATLQERLAALLASGSASGVELQMTRRDGAAVLVHVEARVGVDPTGAFERTHCVLHDVTRHRRAEEALRASEARFRSTFDASAVGMAIIDRDGRFQTVNAAATRILGYSEQELLALTNLDITHPEDRARSLERFRQCLADGMPYTIEKRYLDRDGALKWGLTTISPVTDSAGHVRYVLAQLQDITEGKRAQELARESEGRFRELIEQSPLAIALINAEGRITELNAAFMRLFSLEERVMKAVLERYNVFEDEQAGTQGLLPLVGRVFSGEEVTLERFPYDSREAVAALGLSRTGAGRLWLRGRLFPVRQSQGAVQYAVLMLEDETRQKEAEDRLQQAAAVFQSTAEGVTITDLDGTILDVNAAFTEITGYSREEIIGQNPRILQSGRQGPAFYSDMWQSLREAGFWRGEVWNRRKDGTVFPELLTINTVRDPEGNATGYVGVFADITSMKRSEERLDHLAHHDALTGLPNRLLFNARLRQSIRHSSRQGARLAVIFVDLDRFKHVNDSLGHTAGDELLTQLALRLQGALRSDDTVARISGDEFVVLLEDVVSADNAAAVVRKLMGVFKDPFELAGQTHRITASMGVSLYPEDADEASALLRNADAAMYRAKEEGRSTYQFYTAEMTAAAFEHVFLENALIGAMERDELHLVYQPQVDLETGRVLAVEALLRWHHPEQGVISPGRFIPVAEQSGIIRDIGAWVLDTACRQARAWLDRGLDFGRVAVNVAGPQIQQGAFAERVGAMLAHSELPAERLELEVTEGFVMQRAEQGIRQLELLGDMGVEIAIDDFGTGYSSLSYLKHLPIDKLKIDQSFVRDIPHDADDMAISEAVIALGSAMDMRVVAEGVETAAQRDFLWAKGCREAQGFYFGRPLEPAALEALLAGGH